MDCEAEVKHPFFDLSPFQSPWVLPLPHTNCIYMLMALNLELKEILTATGKWRCIGTEVRVLFILISYVCLLWRTPVGRRGQEPAEAGECGIDPEG